MRAEVRGGRFEQRLARRRDRPLLEQGVRLGGRDGVAEGEAFGVTEKKVECIVTGGLGKIPVSYMGQTYYVCCTGCRDAFNENPAKIRDEWKAKKKAGK